MSCPAKAGHPVAARSGDSHSMPRITGSSAFADDDDRESFGQTNPRYPTLSRAYRQLLEVTSAERTRREAAPARGLPTRREGAHQVRRSALVRSRQLGESVPVRCIPAVFTAGTGSA